LFRYSSFFKVHRRNNTPTALNYLKGLLLCEKNQANMERMEEEVSSSEYHIYQHFISNSNWDYQGANIELGKEVSEIMENNKAKTGRPTGLIIDESAHLKKGKHSVGVSRQYAGVAGKVDNCQVGVYASLCNDKLATLVDERLFLPEKWTIDPERCKKAGVPLPERKYKTKPQLALELVDKQLENGVKFDWVGGDGLYGHSFELTTGLEQRGVFYLLDVHSDEKVYLTAPEIVVPERRSYKGRKPKKEQPNKEAIRLDNYCKALSHEDWEIVKVRKAAKGTIKLKVHKARVWVWREGEKKVVERTLVISKSLKGDQRTKYSFSNGGYQQYTCQEYAWFQSQRYWVERCFDDAKNELGLSDHQVRKWIGWHHHHTLVMLACLLLLKAKLDKVEDFPLMSVRDARIIMIVSLFGTEEQYEERLEQMRNRHKKRKYDIDRYD
jgi:SRSO17 transposase